MATAAYASGWRDRKWSTSRTQALRSGSDRARQGRRDRQSLDVFHAHQPRPEGLPQRCRGLGRPAVEKLLKGPVHPGVPVEVVGEAVEAPPVGDPFPEVGVLPEKPVQNPVEGKAVEVPGDPAPIARRPTRQPILGRLQARRPLPEEGLDGLRVHPAGRALPDQGLQSTPEPKAGPVKRQDRRFPDALLGLARQVDQERLPVHPIPVRLQVQHHLQKAPPERNHRKGKLPGLVPPDQSLHVARKLPALVEPDHDPVAADLRRQLILQLSGDGTGRGHDRPSPEKSGSGP